MCDIRLNKCFDLLCFPLDFFGQAIIFQAVVVIVQYPEIVGYDVAFFIEFEGLRAVKNAYLFDAIPD